MQNDSNFWFTLHFFLFFLSLEWLSVDTHSNVRGKWRHHITSFISLHSIDLLPICWFTIETFVVSNTEPEIASHSGRLLVAIFRSRYMLVVVSQRVKQLRNLEYFESTQTDSPVCYKGWCLEHSDWLANVPLRLLLKALRLIVHTMVHRLLLKYLSQIFHMSTPRWEKDWNIRNLAWITIGLCTWKSTACSSFKIKDRSGERFTGIEGIRKIVVHLTIRPLVSDILTA